MKRFSTCHLRSLAAAVSILLGCWVSVAGEKTIASTVDQGVPPEIARIDAPFDMRPLARPTFRKEVFDIRRFGAIGDGRTKNTAAFREAIDACSAAGGGKVFVPAGKWFTGAIHLKSDVNLHFDVDAELHFSDDPQDYLPVVFTRWAGFELYNFSPLIYARDCRNIAITGPGRLFGHGRDWWSWKMRQADTCRTIYQDQVLREVPPERRIYGTEAAGLRPQFINPVNCTNVLFEGFHIMEPGPFWTIHPYRCENVIIRGLKIDTYVDHATTGVGGPNTDAIDIDSCNGVLIEYCHVTAGDDCFAIKSGINEDGWRVGRPSENVVIRHVWGGRCHGGIVVGSDTSGGIRHLYAMDCEFVGADRGIRLKSNASRGGVVEGIWCQDIRMREIQQEAIVINTDYGAWMAAENGAAYPVFRNLTVRDMTCDQAGTAVRIIGSPYQPIQNLTLERVTIEATTGSIFEWVDGLRLIGYDVNCSEGEKLYLENCRNVVERDEGR
jgi:polygalacturonase